MKLVHYDLETIHINGTAYSFSDFKKLEPQYSAPYGFSIRVYERGKIHYASDGFNTIYLPVECPECNRICDREGELSRLVLRLSKECRGW